MARKKLEVNERVERRKAALKRYRDKKSRRRLVFGDSLVELEAWLNHEMMKVIIDKDWKCGEIKKHLCAAFKISDCVLKVYRSELDCVVVPDPLPFIPCKYVVLEEVDHTAAGKPVGKARQRCDQCSHYGLKCAFPPRAVDPPADNGDAAPARCLQCVVTGICCTLVGKPCAGEVFQGAVGGMQDPMVVRARERNAQALQGLARPVELPQRDNPPAAGIAAIWAVYHGKPGANHGGVRHMYRVICTYGDAEEGFVHYRVSSVAKVPSRVLLNFLLRGCVATTVTDPPHADLERHSTALAQSMEIRNRMTALGAGWHPANVPFAGAVLDAGDAAAVALGGGGGGGAAAAGYAIVGPGGAAIPQ